MIAAENAPFSSVGPALFTLKHYLHAHTSLHTAYINNSNIFSRKHILTSQTHSSRAQVSRSYFLSAGLIVHVFHVVVHLLCSRSSLHSGTRADSVLRSLCKVIKRGGIARRQQLLRGALQRSTIARARARERAAKSADR